MPGARSGRKSSRPRSAIYCERIDRMQSRLQDRSRPPEPLARLFDSKVLGYATALFVVVPFLVLYIDGSVATFILSVQSEWGWKVASAITIMGSGLTDAAIAGALLVVGLKAGRPREAVAGRLGLLAVIVGSLSAQILKNLFCRSRPLAEKSGQFFVDFPCLGKGSGFISFPSGHSVTAFALAFVLRSEEHTSELQSP